MVEHEEDRRRLSKWGNDLRQTYRTLGQAAGLSEIDMHLLMNHSLPGVNAGYITRARLLGDPLRSAQEKLSQCIVEGGRSGAARRGQCDHSRQTSGDTNRLSTSSGRSSASSSEEYRLMAKAHSPPSRTGWLASSQACVAWTMGATPS